VNCITKIAYLFFFIFLFWACKKDNNVLGVDVQPTDDALNAIVITEPVYAHTIKYDSIISLNDRYKYLGSNLNPYFGQMDVGLYLNANIPDGKTYVSFGDDANLTSSEIILAINGLGLSYAGDQTSIQTYSVFPISSALDPAKVYYNTPQKLYSNSALLGVYTGSYTTVNGKLALRIPIDNNFGRAVLNNPQYLVDNTTFQNTYKGFYIKSSINSGEGIIAEFDLEDELSGFYLYYQNGSSSATKVDKSYRFTFSGANVNPIRFNTLNYNPTIGGNNSIIQQLVVNDTTKGADYLFLKGMGATRLKVQIPFLKSQSDSFKIAVNRAEVIFNIDPLFNAGTANYPVPTKLCLLALDSLGKETFALDQTNVTDRGRYDGSYDDVNNRYVFNIARHAQAILSGKIKNYGFYLVVANADNIVSYRNIYYETSKELLYLGRDRHIEQVVLSGSNNAALKPVLNLSYIKFKNE
jgi:hypothetical protein